MRKPLVVALPILAICWAGCGTPHQTPKAIEADGQSYVACSGMLWVEDNSGLGGAANYEIKFTDANGTDHDIRGVKKLEITDLPDDTPLCKK